MLAARDSGCGISRKWSRIKGIVMPIESAQLSLILGWYSNIE